MQGRSRFYLYIFIIILASFLGLRAIDYFTKYGAAEINGRKFRVEVIKTDWERERGLSGRRSLSVNRGMLFVFPAPGRHAFWMKDMMFPIDIIWINGEKIVDIKEKAPTPTTQYLEQYRPDAPAKYVLEINAGLSEKYGLKIGDAVKLDI